MCRAVSCKTCGKTTWSGCGAHIEHVKASVPSAQWCPGHERPSSEPRASRFGRLFKH
jgi:hypothetical protein